jgi:hypothetical protein
MATTAGLLKRFDGELKALTKVSAEKSLLTAKPIVLERLLEAVFLSAFTQFESFLDDLFHLAVCGGVPGAKPIASFSDEKSARAIIEHEVDYLVWLPVDKTLARAYTFLEAGEPFGRMARRRTISSTMATAHLVRNAIAHKSGIAPAKFERQFGARYSSPGEYLASRSGSGTMCRSYLSTLASLGRALGAPDSVSAEVFVGPPDPYRSGSRPSPGDYECTVCGTVYTLGAGDALLCTTCDPVCPECSQVVTRTAVFREVKPAT